MPSLLDCIMSTGTSTGTYQEGPQGLGEKSTCASTLWQVPSSNPARLVFLSLELVKGEWVKFIQMITHTNDFMHYSPIQTDVHLCWKV